MRKRLRNVKGRSPIIQDFAYSALKAFRTGADGPSTAFALRLPALVKKQTPLSASGKECLWWRYDWLRSPLQALQRQRARYHDAGRTPQCDGIAFHVGLPILLNERDLLALMGRVPNGPLAFAQTSPPIRPQILPVCQMPRVAS